MRWPAGAGNYIRLGWLIAVLVWCLAVPVSAEALLDAGAAARSGAPDLDAAMGGLAGAAGLVLLGWLALTTACAVVSTALPAGSAVARGAHRLGRRITPVAMRRVLGVAVSAALFSGALPAQAATTAGTGVVATAGHFAGEGSRHDAGLDAAVPSSIDLDPGWFTTAAATTAAAIANAAGTAGLAPGWGGSVARSEPVRRAAPTQLDPTWGPPGRLRSGVHPQSDVVVRRGDTLWDVAARHLGPAATDAEIAGAWPHWFAANRTVIGPDPDVLRPGQRLTPPASTSGGVA